MSIEKPPSSFSQRSSCQIFLAGIRWAINILLVSDAGADRGIRSILFVVNPDYMQ